MDTKLFICLGFLFLSWAGYLGGAIFPFFFARRPHLSNWAAHGCAVIAAVSGLAAGLMVIVLQFPVRILLPTVFPLAGAEFYIDGMAALFIAVINLLALAGSVYALGYVREFYGKKHVALLGAMYNVFIMSMLFVVSANNALLFLIVWEVMSLSSFFLVNFDHTNSANVRAGFIYIVMTHIGTVFITLAFLALFSATGSFSFDAFRAGGAAMPASAQTIVFLLALVGFGTKAGLMPAHVWLPLAHPAAPSHVSALMSGVMVKTAVYGLLRVIFAFLGTGPVWWGLLLLALAALSAVLGVLYATQQQDLKRLLAFSTVENIGIILLGVGAGVTFAALSMPALAVLGLLAALYHLLNHAVFKGLLFLGAGAVLHATHTKHIDRLGGLIRRMPFTAACFLVGAAAIAALPPLNGFMGEWLTFQALLLLGFNAGSEALRNFAAVVAGALVLTGALVAACFVKAFGGAFLALPRSGHAEAAREAPRTMRLAMGFLALACVLLGLWPAPVLHILQDVISGLIPGSVAFFPEPGQWLSVVLPQEGFANLAPPVIAGILAITLLAAWLAARIWGGQGRRIDETWVCGISLQPVMEYTGSSFSQPIKIIFRRIFQPRRTVDKLHETHPYFVRVIKYHARVTPLFEEYLYRPLSRMVFALADRLHRIQAGSLQLYLAYILATLIVLLAVAK